MTQWVSSHFLGENPWLCLPEDEIHLWFAFAGDFEDPHLPVAARKVLDPGEIARVERMRHAKDRHLFLLSHLLARTALSRYRPRSPEEWRFVRNSHGKPSLDPETEPVPLQFSLSHTTGLSVFAVTRTADIGVDVEMVNRPVEALKLSRRFFSPGEAAHLRKMAPERLSHFFYYWTLKESFLKALGRGLSLPLDSFAFHLSEERPCRITLSGKDLQHPEGCRFALIQPTKGYVAALSVALRQPKPMKVACFRALPFEEAASLDWTPAGLSEGVECISRDHGGRSC